MEVNILSPQYETQATSTSADSLGGLGSDDFLQLLIAQLTNQDPMEPTSNEELLNQISSIRDIELSTSLTSTLEGLTGQQRFASASTLIGQYVTGLPDSTGVAASGVVIGVRFETDGLPVLQLSDGTELAIEQVNTIESPRQAAEALIGSTVVGVDKRQATDPEVVEGVVAAVQVESDGEVLLELDTGEDLRFRDLVSVTAEAV